MKIEYSKSKYRGGHEFGQGTNYKLKLLDRGKTQEEIISEAQLAGWSNGCSISRELTGPNSPFSPEWILQRYTHTNKWFTFLCNSARQINPPLSKSLREYTPRFSDEQVNKHEPLSVPLLHLTHISPMSMPWGYASSRVLIEIIRSKGNNEAGAELAYSIMVDGIEHSETPRQLLAILSEKVALAGVDPVNVLEHTLATVILEEHSCRREFILIAEELEKNAPTIMQTYLSLSSEEKRQLEIAEIPYL